MRSDDPEGQALPEERPASDDMSWFKELNDSFAPVRSEIVDRGLSEEEVNADIDAAVRAVRAQGATAEKLG